MPKVSTATIKLYQRNSQPNANGEYVIMLRVFYNGRKDRSTGIWCRKEDWNDNKQQIRASAANAQLLNAQLQMQVNDIYRRKQEYELTGANYTVDDLFEDRKVVQGNTVRGVCMQMFKEYSYKHSTEKNYDTLFHHVGDVLVTDIDDQFIATLIRTKFKDMKNSSIMNMLARLHHVLTFAEDKGMIRTMPKFTARKGIKVNYRHKALSVQQLQCMREYADSNDCKDTQRRYLYLYLLGYYFQGMALCDLMNIRNCDLMINTKQQLVYHGQRRKTQHPLTIVIDCTDPVFWRIWTYVTRNDTEYMIDWDGRGFQKGDDDKEKYRKAMRLGNRLNRALKQFANDANAGLIEQCMDCEDYPENMSYYSIRHTFATTYIRNDGNLVNLATLMGRSVNNIGTYIKELTDDEDIIGAKSVLPKL